MSRANLVAGMLLLVMFLTGMTSGIVIQQLLSPSLSIPTLPPGRFPASARGREGPGPGGFDVAILTRRLNLSPEQGETVDRIIREQQRQMDSLLMSIRPHIEAEFGALSEQINEVLTPDQRIEFAQFVDDGFARLGARNPLVPPPDRRPLPLPR